MHDGTFAGPGTFIIADDNSESNCMDEQANNNSINNTYNNTYLDAQPDIFVVDAPGLNCRLMLDNQGVFRDVLSAQDLKVEFENNYSNDRYFVITNQEGVKYTFAQYSKTSRKLLNDLYNIDLFRRAGNFYATQLGYPDIWYLTEIKSIINRAYGSLSYTYVDQPVISSSDNAEVYIKNNAADTARKVVSCYIQNTITGRKYLKSIYNSLGSKVEFPGTAVFPSTIEIYNSTAYQAPVDRKISFWTRGAYNSYNGGSKQFITTIYDESNGCTKKLYKFDYYGVASSGSGLSEIPVSNTHKTDAWGYPNGSDGTSAVKRIYVYPALQSTTGVYRPYPIPGYSGTSFTLAGNDGAVNEEKIMLGTLSRITYPNGGSSSFEYESNVFMDEDANAEVKGGGIRIKAINTFDGIHPEVVMRKEFTYLNDLAQTSGKINYLPVYALTTPYYFDPISNVTKNYNTIVSAYGVNSASFWNHLTVRSERSLLEGSEVSYAQVTTRELGNGSIKETFNTPSYFLGLGCNGSYLFGRTL